MANRDRNVARAAVIVGAIGMALFGARWLLRHRSPPSDLAQGGAELVLDVDVDRAIDRRFARDLDELVANLRERRTPIAQVAPKRGEALLRGTALDEAQLAGAMAGSELQGALEPGGDLRVVLPAELTARLRDALLEKTGATIRERVQRSGVCVPSVRVAQHRLIVGLPGATDRRLSELRRLITTEGRLEIRVVDESDALDRLAAELPSGSALRLERDRWAGPGGDSHQAPVVVGPPDELAAWARSRAGIAGGLTPAIELVSDEHRGPSARLYLVGREIASGEDVTEAAEEVDRATGEPRVALVLSPRGAERYRVGSGENVGRKLAILIDGQVTSAPVLRSPIEGGRLQITVGGAERSAEERAREAAHLATVLRVGALPAPVTIASEKRIAPRR